MSRARPLLRALLLTLLGATALWAWPWSRDLVVQLFIKPQQQMFLPASGTVQLQGESPLAREVAAWQLRNPLVAEPQGLEQGKKLYETYCLVCHGPQGRGDGPVAGGAMLPADLTTARVQAQADGMLYDTLRHGFGNMPAYYDRLTPQERWLVVLYVRTLAPPTAGRAPREAR